MFFQTIDWPLDLEEKDDLSSSMREENFLRENVQSLLDKVIPVDKNCNMHYFGAIVIAFQLSSKLRTEYLVDTLKDDRIETVSECLLIITVCTVRKCTSTS